MVKYITKIKVHNYKKFADFSIDLDEKTNILVGDNDAGKSSILTAIELVLNASNSRVATIGYENLMNVACIKNFLSGDRAIERLPEMWIELYLNEQNKEELNGDNNSDGINCDGIKLAIVPTEALEKEIKEFLEESNDTFPFDYYHTSFTTFAGEPYHSYRNYLKSTNIDNTKGSDDYAISEFIKSTYYLNIEGQEERAKHHAAYRAMKAEFTSGRMQDINERLEGDYSFQLKTSNKSNIETDLAITENGISLENHGKGQQVVMKAELTLKKSATKPDVVLIEEPENHLSHVNMDKLIATINANSGQLIISTHSNLISSRLDLKHCILINSSSNTPLKLNQLSEDTAGYFMKAPPHNVLDFTLSKKALLVEGVAEYILLKQFFKSVTGHESYDKDVHIITVGGTAFKRYLEIAKILGIRTGVIRDNDGVANQDFYPEFLSDGIKVFTDQDAQNRTFEIAFYNANTDFCKRLFNEARVSLSVLDYMLKNKSDVAYEILKNYDDSIVVPEYIAEAIRWVSE